MYRPLKPLFRYSYRRWESASTKRKEAREAHIEKSLDRPPRFVRNASFCSTRSVSDVPSKLHHSMLTQ
mgnify:CR=1 FL=1